MVNLTANWIERTADKFNLVGGVAKPSGAAQMPIASYALAMLFNDHKITATMKTPGINDFAILYLRGNTGNQVALVARNGNRWQIFTCNDYAQVLNTGVLQQLSQDALSWVDGDTITIAAQGNCYTVFKNGGYLFRWPDEDGVYAANVDAFHHECSIGYRWGTGTSGGFDRVDLDDLYVWPSLAGGGGDGIISATAIASYPRSADLLGTGQLTATVVPVLPDIVSVSPSSGAYDTSVAITGTNFVGVTSVTIGGQAVRNLNVVNSTQITCNPPGLTNGAKDVVVTTTAGSDTATNGFTYSYTPVNETNTNRASVAIPVGSQGCWVTLIAAGGAGGNGAKAVDMQGWLGCASAGGGGGRIQRVFLSRTILGATYSVTRGLGVAGAAGGLSRFTSASVNLTANGGGRGTNATNGSTTDASPGGSGGTTTISGVTATGRTGVTGATSNSVGQGSSSTLGGAGGGGGGYCNDWSTDAGYVGGDGGGTTGISGGAAGTAGSPGSGGTGGTPTSQSAAQAQNAGGAGGGSGGGGTTGTGGNGGAGGLYGGGGGAGGGVCSPGSAGGTGGTGGSGYTLVEWI